MIHLDVDLSDFRRLQSDLRDIASRAVPFAIRNALNNSAFAAREIWQDEIKQTFTNRNKYTAQSIRVEKTRTLHIRSMDARVGSLADYMRTQEFGGSEAKAIPTEVAAGQAMGSAPRTKTVRAPNKITAIRLTDRARTGSRKVRNRIAIRRALKTGNKFVLLELERGEGIFRIMGGRRNLQVRMVWDLRRGPHTIPPHPTLGPTLKRLEPKLLGIHTAALAEQLMRHRSHKVFTYTKG